jgi:hypothetical protein
MSNENNKEVPVVQTAQVDLAHEFLEDAVSTMKARAILRDKPTGERTAAQIAEVFNALSGHSLTEADVWQLMIVLKLVRARNGAYLKDDYIDLAAYAGLLGQSESENKERNK